jgi:hypothetical protein
MHGACQFMDSRLELAHFGLNASSWLTKRKIRIAPSTTSDGKCHTIVTILDAQWDWAEPEATYDLPCAGLKDGSNGVTFERDQCVFQSLGAPPVVLWTDGPSNPYTAKQLNDYFSKIGFGMRFLSAGITGKVAATSINDMAAIMSHYRKLFLLCGINHDLCYHHEGSSHGMTKAQCDNNFHSDNHRMCDLTGDAGRTLIVQSDGLAQVRVVWPATCYEWADLFYWFVSFDATITLHDLFSIDLFSFSGGAWKASNIEAPYNRLDVAQMYSAQFPPAAPPTTQGIYVVNRITMTVYMRGDDKDPDTIGSVKFMLTGSRAGETLAILPIPNGHWDDQHTYTFDVSSLLLFTHDELYTVGVQPVFDWVTRGHDLGRFDMEITTHFVDDKAMPVTYCYSDVRVGNCGDACGLFRCPTNHCAWTGEAFPVGVQKESRCTHRI